ncbi:lipoprotein insertase outer membrane protein LolB [Thalassotalea aquiviva]|uniref:lipoprotein insertase outer membrane protein LolB n=1 Tax=Thalassotalea aquiviva TaxID=3242415 RepID=UPI00352A11D4
MFKSSPYWFILLVILLNGCASQYSTQELFQDKNQRSQELKALNDWTIKGKIAFLTTNDKQSANFYWQQQDDITHLKLTTFLGVSLLSLTHDGNTYHLHSNGEHWQDDNLNTLLMHATGLNLPVSSLIYWLKGLKASSDDSILYSPTTQLPLSLHANKNNQPWQVNYQHYTLVETYRLADKLTVVHPQLTIKMAIYNWELN